MRVWPVMLAGLVVIVAACSGRHASSIITTQELATRINNNFAPVILDVRSVHEYSSGHIPGAINIPLIQQPIYQTVFNELKLVKKTEIIIYSETTSASSAAVKNLKEQGFFEVRQLDGGIKKWRKSGFKLEIN